MENKNRIKIICVAGTRPNFIKIAPLAEAFKKTRKADFILVHTGQHYNFEMSKLFFDDLKIPVPDYNLAVGSGTHVAQTIKMMAGLEKIFLKENPDIVIVVGDVNSALAGALTAAKLDMPVCHVEAGIRSYDKKMPEEINRILTDHVSNWLFSPTSTAVNNLKKEGIKKGVYNTGDITYDTFLKNIKTAEKSKILKKIKVKPKNYLILTVHRPSNTDNLNNLKNILEVIEKIKKEVVFPVHPRTAKILRNINTARIKNLNIIKPVSYFDMLFLEKNALKIITDSGGMQKEAYWLKVPCITLRDSTEWPETLKDRWNILVGSDKAKIIRAVERFNPTGKQNKHFGSGNAAEKMAEILAKKQYEKSFNNR